MRKDRRLWKIWVILELNGRETIKVPNLFHYYFLIKILPLRLTINYTEGKYAEKTDNIVPIINDISYLNDEL